jgi:hypothetical protein
MAAFTFSPTAEHLHTQHKQLQRQSAKYPWRCCRVNSQQAVLTTALSATLLITVIECLLNRRSCGLTSHPIPDLKALHNAPYHICNHPPPLHNAPTTSAIHPPLHNAKPLLHTHWLKRPVHALTTLTLWP